MNEEFNKVIQDPRRLFMLPLTAAAIISVPLVARGDFGQAILTVLTLVAISVLIAAGFALVKALWPR